MFGIGLCLLTIVLYAQGECSDGCNEPTLFYDDLDCKPIFASPDDCCPTHYDCSAIVERARSNAEQCYFRGKTYTTGESINDDETNGYCKVDCTCRKQASGNMGFTCASLKCLEWFQSQLEPGCHRKYDLDKCCSIDVACEPSNATCKVNDITYHEGQWFEIPSFKCMECICQEGFLGKFEKPFCKKISCFAEVQYQKEITNFCAPLYIIKDEDCCPFDWICPEDSDKIVPAQSITELKCKFGDQNLNIGDTFSRSIDKISYSCECRVPPYLTCIPISRSENLPHQPIIQRPHIKV